MIVGQLEIAGPPRRGGAPRTRDRGSCPTCNGRTAIVPSNPNRLLLAACSSLTLLSCARERATVLEWRQRAKPVISPRPRKNRRALMIVIARYSCFIRAAPHVVRRFCALWLYVISAPHACDGVDWGKAVWPDRTGWWKNCVYAASDACARVRVKPNRLLYRSEESVRTARPLTHGGLASKHVCVPSLQ